MRFLLTHPVWDVTMPSPTTLTSIKFLLTHPVWDVTYQKPLYKPNWQFLLTHPVWDVTIDSGISSLERNFYSHIPCGM